jgi:beta-lactamase superfamily II metal-dependent hydrolase
MTELQTLRIRMYRQGLGDCFLLTFTNSDQKKHHMLIDCGVLPLSKGGNQRLDRVAQNILAETDRHLDVVVATHEHADHVSGFKSANEFFGVNPKKKPNQPTQVGQVWLAWTENKEDEQVKKILARTETLGLAITAAMQGMAETQSQPIQDLLLFSGNYLDADDALSDAEALGVEANPNGVPKKKFKIAKTIAQIMDWLRAWGPVDYLEPGDVREIPEFGIKFYILGPSRKMSMLGGGGPDGRPGSMPVAGGGLKLTQSRAFLAAAAHNAGLELEAAPGEGLSQADLDSIYRLSLPFDPTRFLELNEAGKPYPLPEQANYPDRLQAMYRDFFNEFYGDGVKEATQGPKWRRIDSDWLQMGEQLALQQVSTVNNTSLVFALELTESGKVLLFVGDAEEESWQTWENTSTNLDKLLANTVVYKVGHHGSINATDQEVLQKKMTHPDLVALIPVDMKRADEKNWEFPAKSLFDPSTTDVHQKGLLFKQTHGRILLNCDPEGCKDSDPSFEADNPWPGKISADPTPEKLWVDYTLTLD